MGIERLAFMMLKILWETLEGLHLAHVAHIAGKAGYKGGSHIKHAIQQRCQEWEDKKNPDKSLERKAETSYDFQTVGNTSLNGIHKQAEDYLVNLEGSVRNLDKAKKYFVDIHSTLTDITKDLESNDSRKCPSYLLSLQNNLERFKAEFSKFLSSIEPPPRQLLYIAGLNKIKVIERYNSSLIDIKNYIKRLEEIEQAIANSEIMRAPSTNNAELISIYADIVLAYAKFQQIDITKLNDPFDGKPSWSPLLIEEKEIEEVGQRIFLHAMHEAENSKKEKLLIAEIFLRKPISQHEMKQMEVDHLVYEMASKLRGWQIKKCDELLQFLSELKEGTALPKHDRNGLLAWLQANEKKQSSLQLLKEILVEPCSFSQCSMGNESDKSAESKLKKLLSIENSEKLIKEHLASHWSTIWEKNDTLIQLPSSFNTKIYPSHRMELDNALERPYVVSAVMHKLAKALMVDIQYLKEELADNKDFYAGMDTTWVNKQTELCEAQKNQTHEGGVARIKKSQTRMPAINSLSSSLYPYLYRSETFNQEDKKRQVPTVDDLLQVIYFGIDPNGVCQWEPPYPTISQNNQLMYYFMPTQEQNDSKTDAWVYAYKICQADRISVLSHLFLVPQNSLAIIEKHKLVSDIAIKNGLSVQVIQATSKDSNKTLSINTNSKALRSVTPKMAQEIESLFNQLQNYYVLALVRMELEYLSLLPFLRRFKFKFDNFLKSNDEIGKERLASAKIYVSDLCAVLSEERVELINQALVDLEARYASRAKDARSKYNGHKGELYTIMEKLMNGPIAAIKEQMKALEPPIDEQQKQENAVVVDKEDEEKETIQARGEEVLKEKDAEIERLKASLAARERQMSPQPGIAGSRVTLFSVPTTSQAANTTAENSVLPEHNYAP
ncbi:hypothetical protein [Rickettsiella endosymbiont of Dermanyssus gallinae]|uniref:hypothetical protein n=1 Tax=Rickettsiella endosymbiont of Dermanyssus gallinae TaxID=2856608 RepID=UPI001C5308A7|nr:hypothetical protein [Rickettsiella endosymbiont of Dermanyssus gallinae]